MCAAQPVFRGSQWPGFGDADMGRFSGHVRPVQERRQPVKAGVIMRWPIAGRTSHMGGSAAWTGAFRTRDYRSDATAGGWIEYVPTPSGCECC